MAPDERAVREDLRSARFQLGVDGGRWRLLSFEWPVGFFAVAAAERPGSPVEYVLRIDFSGYPQHAPTATPWDLDCNDQLSADERPKGQHVGHVFRTDWNHGQALYAPWDRVALEGHSNWVNDHVVYAWHPRRDIAFFLGCVYDLLNDDDYTGV